MVIIDLLKQIRDLVSPLLISLAISLTGAIGRFLFMYWAFDLLLKQTSPSLGNLLGLIGLALLIAGAAYGEHYFGHDLAFKALSRLRIACFNQISRLSPQILDQQDASQLLQLISADIDSVEVFYAHTLVPILKAIFYGLFLIIFYANIGGFYGLSIAILIIILGLLIPMIYQRGVKAKEESRVQNEQIAHQHSFESLAGRQELQQLGLIQASLIQNEELQAKVQVGQVQKYRMEQVKDFLVSISILLIGLAMYLYFVRIPASYQTTIGLIIVPLILQPFLSLVNLPNSLSKGLESAHRITDLLRQEPAPSGSNILTRIESLELDGVSFAYPGKNLPILDKIDLQVKAGQTIGLVGDNGSGKSTLIRLIMGWYPAKSGQIAFNGIPIDQLDKDSLAKQINYLSQNIHFFNESIRDNLTLGADISDEEIWAVLDQLEISHLVKNLASGLDTLLGPNDQILSSGESQTLALARALLHPSSLLILDEPTSHLDLERETLVLNKIQRYYQGIIILITHHPQNLDLCDQVYELKDGQAILN